MKAQSAWGLIQLGLVTFGGFLGWYLGGLDSFLYALIIFIAVDYLTGIMCAIHDKKLSSKIGSRGIFKKVMILLLVGIAHMVDSQVIGHDSVLRTAVIFFYLSNEGISILENAAHLGLPVPTRLKEILRELHSEKEEAKEKALDRGDHADVETAVPETVIDAVVDTVKESVRLAVRETLMEAASEIGGWPDIISLDRNPVQEVHMSTELPPILDADPNADLSGEEAKK